MPASSALANLQAIQTTINVILGAIALLTAVVGWIAWVVKKSVPTRSEHTQLSDRITSVERTVERIDQIAKALPSRAELHELQLQLERFNGNTRVLSAQLEAARELQQQTRTLVGVMHEHLLTEKR